MGEDQTQWRWGRVHTLTLHHPAATTPLLRELLDRGPVEHGGTWNTLNNSLYEPGAPFKTFSGVSYRLLADLAGECLGIIPGGESGHPASPHYADQLPLWLQGRYHRLDLPDAPAGPVWELRPE
jgi:penicillin amidase